jgi:hypothetical protein
MSDSYEVTGQIKRIDSMREYGDKGFRVREFIIETVDEKYPQPVKLQVVNDACDTLDEYNIGDNVTVAFNLRGKEMDDGRVFNNLQAWRMDHQEGKQTVAEAETEAAIATAEAHAAEQDDDKLPF